MLLDIVLVEIFVLGVLDIHGVIGKYICWLLDIALVEISVLGVLDIYGVSGDTSAGC